MKRSAAKKPVPATEKVKKGAGKAGSPVGKTSEMPAIERPAGSGTPMGTRDLDRCRKRLLQEKERIFRTLGFFREENGGGKNKEVGGVPTHIADLGTDVFEKTLELDLSNSEGRILSLINEALEKIDRGTFGICEMCGRRIPMSRLEALPYAKLCIACQRKKERTDG